MRSLFLEEILLKDLAGLGKPAPGTISLAHVLRGSCARGSFGQTRFFFNKKYLVELFLKDLSHKGFNDMSCLI